MGFLKQGAPCFDYFFSAGAAGVVVVVVVVDGAAGALAEDIGACAGAAGAAGAACSAAGAGASSFFLQPADIARAKPRQRAKEISFFIDDITSLFFRFTYTALSAIYYYSTGTRAEREVPQPGATRKTEISSFFALSDFPTNLIPSVLQIVKTIPGK